MVFILLFGRQLNAQDGKLIGCQSNCTVYDFKGISEDTPVVNSFCQSIYNRNALWPNNRHFAVSNKGNLIFSTSDSSLYDYHDNRIPINTSIMGWTYSSGVLATSQLLKFENRKYILVYLAQEGTGTANVLAYSKIDASDYKNIVAPVTHAKIVKDTSLFCTITAARINDTTYVIATLGLHNGIVTFYKVTWSSIKLISSINLNSQLRVFDKDTYLKGSIRSKKFIDNITFSNSGDKLAVIFRENLSDKVLKYPNLFYVYEDILKGSKAVVYTLNKNYSSLIDSSTLFTYTPSDIFDNSVVFEEPKFVFSPHDSFVYMVHGNFPLKNYVNVMQYGIIGTPTATICDTLSNTYFTGPNGFYPLYWGGLFVAYNVTQGIKSKALYISNPDQKFTMMNLNYLAERARDYYMVAGGSNYIFNYLSIKPTMVNKCESIVKFSNFSKKNKGFDKYEFYVAKGPSSTSWDTIVDFEPTIKFSNPGIYAYKCRGYCSSTGYSEIFEDSITIGLPDQSTLISNIDTPYITTVTMLNNSQPLLNWNPLQNSDAYDVYRNGMQIGKTSDTFFADAYTPTMLNQPEYYIVSKDRCGNSSSPSNAAKPVVLNTSKSVISNSIDSIVVINWTPYEYWKEGLLQYKLLISDDQGQSWKIFENTNNLDAVDSTLDNKIIAQRFYKIAAISNQQVEAESNTTYENLSPSIFIPSAFTPNSDGLNDKFIIQSPGLKSIAIKIFNRWGEMLYATNSNNGTIEWIPQENCPSGLYVYLITIELQSGSRLYYRGTVELLK